jgi:hypothetical protein
MTIAHPDYAQLHVLVISNLHVPNTNKSFSETMNEMFNVKPRKRSNGNHPIEEDIKLLENAEF